MDKVIINETQHSDISDIIEKITNTIFKADNQEEKLTYLSSKISTYEYHMHKLIIK